MMFSVSPHHLPVPVPTQARITIFGVQGTGTRGLSPEQSHALSSRERDISFNQSPSLLALISTAPTLKTSQPPPSPSYLLEVVPKPLHDTRQMARQTDGPFTQASRNRHGPARDEDAETDGNVTRRGPGPASITPGRAGASWGARIQQTRGLASGIQERATMRMGRGL